MKQKKEKRIPTSISLSPELSLLVKNIVKVFRISRTELFCLSLFNYLEKLDLEKLKLDDINGVDMLEYIEVCETEIKRRFFQKIRANEISKSLIIHRMRYDVFKLLKFDCSASEIMKVIKVYKKEIMQYKNNEKVLKKINEYLRFEKKKIEYKDFKFQLKEDMNQLINKEFVKKLQKEKND